jgi:hypothetical protein
MTLPERNPGEPAEDYAARIPAEDLLRRWVAYMDDEDDAYVAFEVALAVDDPEVSCALVRRFTEPAKETQ